MSASSSGWRYGNLKRKAREKSKRLCSPNLKPSSVLSITSITLYYQQGELYHIMYTQVK